MSDDTFDLDPTADAGHGHLDDQPEGMIDAPILKTRYGDTQSLSLSQPVPTATEYNGQVGWHMIVDGHLAFMYPVGALSPSQAARMQQNLDTEQPLFYKK